MQGENSNRLCNLPDCLLIHILSWLDAREVAQTCILSKRWRNLWSFVPSLHFDFVEFKGETEKFINFVSSFLRLRDGACKIHTFKLCYWPPLGGATEMYAHNVRTWILYALEHKVKSLQVRLLGMSLWCIPNCVVTSNSVEELHLEGRWEIIETNIVCLPKLRKLVLKHLIIPDDSMKSLLSGCPSLLTLGLWGCFIDMCSISLQTVKSLSLVHCDFRNDSMPLSISAPCLKYLVLFSNSRKFRVTLKDISKLMKVKISSACNLEFPSEISDVQVLELSGTSLVLEGELANA